MKIAFEEMDKMTVKAMMNEREALCDVLAELQDKDTNKNPEVPLPPVITLTIDGIRPVKLARTSSEVISCMDKRRDELRDFLVNAAKDILNFFEEDFSCLSE
jgi:hypothetical protein